MKIWAATFGCGVLCFAVALATGSSTDRKRLVARGKYLVDDVGKCGDCHTPFTKKGELDQTKYLQGAVLGFTPTVPIPNWVDQAPGIVGLPSLDEKDAIHFLMTGLTPDGKKARPPMPSFRFNEADATAIVAYLKSLGSAK